MTIKDSEEALSPSNRRGSDRKKLIIDVNFEGGNATGIANTRDIGIGGLYMTTGSNFDVGTPISMRVMLGGKEVTLGGVIAYTDPGQGVGVRFQGLKDETVNLLKEELEVE